MALAGVVTSGCIRRPKGHIYPENHRLEDSLPGVPKFYATSADCWWGYGFISHQY